LAVIRIDTPSADLSLTFAHYHQQHFAAIVYKMAYSDSKNPFCIDDKDDFAFSQPIGKGYQSSGSKNPFMDEDQDEFENRPLSRYEQLQQKKERSMNNQLDSTQRALSSIYESEQMGVATAEVNIYQLRESLNTVTRL